MAVTRSKAAERAKVSPTVFATAAPGREMLWLLPASFLVVFGLFLVVKAKSRGFDQIQSALEHHQIANLNELSSREELLPYLTIFPDTAQRQFVARKIYYAAGSLPNVGSIARIRVSESEVRGIHNLGPLRERISRASQVTGGERSIAMLTAEQFRALKPLFVVRRPAEFRRTLAIWSTIFLLCFYAVIGWWRKHNFRGDYLLLVPALLLCGAGFILMVSLRDPLRDLMIFVEFSQGVAAGCLLLAVMSSIDYRRVAGHLSYIPLLGSFALSALLLVFGYGPGASDAKVNLFGFQPIEIIRILLVLFLAGYFAQHWEALRYARETRPKIAWLAAHVDLPPLEASLPVLVCVSLSLLFFFLQKDLGPALAFGCLFLALYAVARNGVLLVAAGLTILVGGFAVGYYLGVPQTVAGRVSMWLAPWNNAAHGGDQLAQSLWSFATGGVFGTGLGLGDPALIPAAHTDMVFSALGEEWGYLGLLGIFGLYAAVLYRSLRIARRAATDYEFFLATGLTAAIALQVLLMAGGVLGLTPLTGVVTPFISYGRTSMLANFIMIAMLISVSRNGMREDRITPFDVPVKVMAFALMACGAIVLARAFDVQVLRSGPIVGQGTLVVQADGARRFEYNPRLLEIIRELPKGSIYDRNGLPLATSRWEELESHRAEYADLGIDIDHTVSRNDIRYYPLGALTFHLLGDVRTRFRWAAPNTSFIERDLARRLRGYDDQPTVVEVADPKTGAVEQTIRYDYREVVPLLRHRYEPDSPAMRRILDRPRDVHMTIDARLQVRMAQILDRQLQQTGKQKGALVALDAQSGDLVAAVSAPASLPASAPVDTGDLFLDRARYGLYPPGSTFKVVTAMAALRTNPALAHAKYSCIRLPDNRVGAYLRGSNRPIRDDIRDATPHGTIEMERAIVVSCNAYFAQLGTYDVGAAKLLEVANLFGIAAASPNTSQQLRKSLPQASYGQGQVLASPLQMARVAGTVASGGSLAPAHWTTEERATEPARVLDSAAADLLARYMREVVTQGTGRAAAAAVEQVAGKTGTAELAKAPSHAWFIGFAPYGKAGKRVAFSILIENGQYGGSYAGAAAEIVKAAQAAGLMRSAEVRQ